MAADLVYLDDAIDMKLANLFIRTISELFSIQ